MIIATLSARGRETVIEYTPDQSWTSWSLYRETWDTHIFLGKFSLVHTNHWKRKPFFVTKFAALCGATWGLATAVHALGLSPDSLSELLQTLRGSGPR